MLSPANQARLKALFLVWLLWFLSAMNLYSESKKLYELLGPDFRLGSEKAQALHEKAETSFHAGEYAQAHQLLNEALGIIKASPTPDPRDLPNLLTSIAQVYLEEAEFDKGLPLLKESTEMAEKSLGADHPVVGRALSVWGLTARAKGELNAAIPLLLRSAAIFRKAYGEEHFCSLATSHNLALVYRDQGKYSESLAILEHQLPIAEKFLGSGDREFAQMLNNVSMIYADLGAYDRALPLCRRSLAIRERELGRESPVVAESLNNLAGIYSDQGRQSQALPLLTLSAEIMERCYGTNHPSFAAVLDNLGHVYRNMDDDEQAAAFFLRSFAIKRRVLDSNHPDIARSLQALGELYYASGNNENALNLLGQCLTIRTKAYGVYHPEAAETLQAAAEIYLDQAEFKKALDALRIALDLREKAYGTNHPKIASCLTDLAMTYHYLGNEEASLKLYLRSLHILEQVFGLRHPSVIRVIEGIGHSQQALGRTGAAIDYFAEALKNKRGYLADQVVALPTEMGVRRITNSFFEEEVFHSLSALGTLSNLPNAKPLGAEQLAMDKALLEEIQALQAALDNDPQTSTRELRERVRAVQTQLYRLPESKIDPTERDARRRELRSELATIEAKLAGQNELAAAIIQSREFTLAHIARELPPQSALVDFIQYRRFDFSAKTNQWKEQRYAAYLTFALIADSTNVIVERVDLGEAAPINEAVELICKRMSARQFVAKDLSSALQRVSDLVYAPLSKYLTNVSHLIICPDGQLSRLPFEMLRHNGRFLIEEKTISYIGSGREIVRLAEAAPRLKTNPPLVMGDPDFDFELPGSNRPGNPVAIAQPSTGRSQPPLSQGLFTPAATSSLSRDYRGVKFPRLPGSEEEAKSVAALLGGDCVLRLGKSAREAELKAVVSPRVLHLATHGFFLSDQELKRTNGLRDSWMENLGMRWNASLPGVGWENPLVRCGIALAGANHAKQITNAIAEDGLVTGLEASLLNLQGTELVILSACDSGSGEVKIGEGVMSLRRAFRIAGAETVLASHWKVNDKATSQLMTEFIRRWRSGEPRAKAWRAAQLSLLHSKDFSNPYFWAAFTLTGQWK